MQVLQFLHYLISFFFGSDFCKNFEIQIDFKTCCYEVQSNITKRRINVLSDVNIIETDLECDDELSHFEKKKQIEKVVNSFQSVNQQRLFR